MRIEVYVCDICYNGDGVLALAVAEYKNDVVGRPYHCCAEHLGDVKKVTASCVEFSFDDHGLEFDDGKLYI